MRCDVRSARVSSVRPAALVDELVPLVLHIVPSAQDGTKPTTHVEAPISIDAEKSFDRNSLHVRISFVIDATDERHRNRLPSLDAVVERVVGHCFRCPGADTSHKARPRGATLTIGLCKQELLLVREEVEQ
jgi:hypothetical protein